ncbi:MAG TPA: hypothetical protein VKJ07_25600, partial [Mycobacteriales bacterium]|nr:hypothetical protein [Mycobacteriales bacterium]
VVVAACSGGGGSKHVAAPRQTTIGATAAPTSSTVSPATTCGPATSAGKASGGGDATPPGDIPDNQAFVAFAAPGGTYSIKVPEGWARTDAGTVTSFTDKLNTIRVELKPSASPPSVQSAQTQDVPAIAAQSRCLETPKVSTVQRKSGPAVLITYRADGPPDPVTGKVIHDDVDLGAARREDQDLDVGLGRTKVPAHFEAIDIGKAEVQDDEAHGRRRDRLRPCPYPLHGVSSRLQGLTERTPDHLVVFDDQQLGAAHGRSLR